VTCGTRLVMLWTKLLVCKKRVDHKHLIAASSLINRPISYITPAGSGSFTTFIMLCITHETIGQCRLVLHVVAQSHGIPAQPRANTHTYTHTIGLLASYGSFITFSLKRSLCYTLRIRQTGMCFSISCSISSLASPSQSVDTIDTTALITSGLRDSSIVTSSVIWDSWLFLGQPSYELCIRRSFQLTHKRSFHDFPCHDFP